jgi:hypothetical protein
VAPSLPGFGAAMLWSFAAFLVVVVIVAVLELPKVRWRGGPTFRWAPPLITLLAFGLLNMVMLSVAFVVAHNLGTPVFTTKDAGTGAFYFSPKLGWITPELVIALGVALAVFAGVEYWRLRRHRAADTLSDYHSDTEAWVAARADAPRDLQVWMANALDPPERGWGKTVRTWRWIATAPFDAPLLILLILVLQAVVVAIALGGDWRLPHQLYAPGTIWAKVFIGVATAAPLFLMAQLRAGWKSTSRRKTIGIIWDVGTFWPRSYHPLAPPSYAERAVPDIQRRIWWLHDNQGKTVIAAHSQGSILAATALLQTTCRAEDDEVALVTFGSPLRKLFHWAFPAYFSPEVLEPLAAPDRAARVRVWRNFHYPTDAVASAIFADADDADVRAVDVELVDPATAAYIYGQPQPVVGQHSGYWTDARMWSEVDTIADSL